MTNEIFLKKTNIGDITIKKSASNFIYIQIFYLMIVFFLRDVLGLPSAITYITDLIMLLAFICCLGRIQKSVHHARAKLQLCIILLIVVAVCIGAILNLANPALFIWGVRNNLRFFVFFLSCIVLLEIKDLDNIFKLITFFFWINAIVAIIQYFFFDISKDYLGGLFGTTQGCNIYTNILLCIVMSYKLSMCIKSRISIFNLVIYILTIFFIATLAELKVVYAEFVIVFIITLIIEKPSIKTIGILLLGIIGLIFGLWLLGTYDPDSLNVLMDSDILDRYLSGGGYTNSGDLNRFTAIAQIQEIFFSGNWVNTLFGFGLGSCDTSSFSFLQSDFFNQYEYLHYRWFTHAWVYLEQGAIGLILLGLFFVSILFYCVKHRKVSHGNSGYMLTAFLFTITTIIGIIYNCGLEVEASYLIAFVLAVPFIIVKEKNMH